MNKEQYVRAYSLLAEDCGVAKYYRMGSRTCAIGCLAKAVSPETLALLAVENAMGVRQLKDTTGLDRIMEAFGLDLNGLEALQAANDSRSYVGERRTRVLRVLRQLYHGMPINWYGDQSPPLGEEEE